MTEHASEGGHFYNKDGSPCYEIEGKTGLRPATLRDARKLGLKPGATTIMGLMSKPGLNRWLQEQAIMAALTLPKKENEIDTDYYSRILKDAGEQAKKARERGTQIHAYVQSGFEGKPLTGEARAFYEAAYNTLLPIAPSYKWIPEKSFATDRYGGKVDLHQPGYVVDIKTTDKDVTGLKTWDEHKMQLSAYRGGLGLYNAECFILYINYKAETKLIRIEEEKLQQGRAMFEALLDLYYASTGLVSV